MLVQPITNKNNYYAKPCNTIKKNNSATMPYDFGTTSLPAFADAKSLANINFKAAIHLYAAGYLEGVKKELEKGVDVNIQDKDGWTPLHYACTIGHVDTVKLLCKQKGIELNIQKKDGWTPLHLACNNGHTDIVKYLCEQEGIDVNIQDKTGWTPLHLACSNGHTDIVKYLCEQEGIDVNIQDKTGWTPLHDACYNEHSDIVKYLCEQKDIDVNIQDKDSWTPLFIACHRGRLSIVKLLCEQEGIDLNIQTKGRETPLHQACHHGYSDVVKYLCKRDDIDFTIKDNDGKTALDITEKIGYQYKIWFKKLKEKTEYQLAHPETIGKSKPLTKDEQILEEQKLEEQKKQEDFKQAHDDEYNTKLAMLNTLLQQNGIPQEQINNIEHYLNKIAVNQIRAEEQQKAEQTVQSKMDELQQQQQEVNAEKQTFDELMTTHQILLEQEVSMAQSGFRALYGIQGESIENLGYPEQLVLVTKKLLENKNKLQNTNENTPDDVTKALQNKDGQISNESITFIDRILQSSSKINASDLLDSINAVKNEAGFIDLGKAALFISTLAWGTAIKKVIEKVKNIKLH